MVYGIAIPTLLQIIRVHPRYRWPNYPIETPRDDWGSTESTMTSETVSERNGHWVLRRPYLLEFASRPGSMGKSPNETEGFDGKNDGKMMEKIIYDGYLNWISWITWIKISPHTCSFNKCSVIRVDLLTGCARSDFVTWSCHSSTLLLGQDNSLELHGSMIGIGAQNLPRAWSSLGSKWLYFCTRIIHIWLNHNNSPENRRIAEIRPGIWNLGNQICWFRGPLLLWMGPDVCHL